MQLRLLTCLLMLIAFPHITSAQSVSITDDQALCLMDMSEQRNLKPECVALDKRVEAAALAYAKDADDYTEYYKCFHLDDGEGCSDLALFSSKDEIIETQYAALFFQDRACRLGYDDSCEETTEVLIEFYPVTKHVSFYKRLCFQDNWKACEQLTNKLTYWQNSKLFKDLCIAGNYEACETIEEKRPIDRNLKLHQSLCLKGSSYICEELEHLDELPVFPENKEARWAEDYFNRAK